MGLFSFFNKELAIDLGTANTIIIYNDKVVVDEPSIVAIERDTQKIMAVGKRAMMMHGKTHENIKTIRPLRDGVIADFQAAEYMLRDMIKMINFHNSIFPPALKMVICIPSGITEVEERAVKDSAEQAGAKEVRLIHEPTGIVVSCQVERSQHQNREVCMKMLKSKLIEIKEREHLDKIEDIKGEQKEIGWGSQIRSYVFMPYTLVKDHRTGFEMGNINAVMDGDIDGFLNAYLKKQSLDALNAE